MTLDRSHLLAHLAAERARLLAQFVGLDLDALTTLPIWDDWTAKDILAHVAAWDELFTERIELILAGREDEITRLDLDARNAALHAERKDWPLQRALQACLTARAKFLKALSRLSDQALQQQRAFSFGEVSALRWTHWRARHDAAHAADLTTLCQTHGSSGETGPPEILLAALKAARDELLAAVALVPVAERDTRPVCGDWTLQDVLGHIADWEWVGVEGLRDMAAGNPPQIESVDDIEAWNQAHYNARRDQPWEGVWNDLHAARGAFLEALQGMTPINLAQTHTFPWGPQGTAYRWVHAYLSHDREHAQDVRGATGTPA